MEDGRVKYKKLSQESFVELEEFGSSYESKTQGLSIVSAVFFIVGDVVGAGLIALPYTLNLAGWYGIPMLFTSACVTAYCGILLSQAVNKILGDSPMREALRDPYPTLAENAAGVLSRHMVSFFLNLSLVLITIVFLLLAGEILSKLVPLSIHGLSYRDELRIWFIICGIVLLPFTFLGTPKDFWGIAIMATFTSFVAAILILCNLTIVQTSLDFKVSRPKPTAENVFASYGTILFAFGGVAIFPTIQNDLQEPQKFSRAVTIGYIIVTTVYLIVPITTYAILGGLIKEDVLTTMTELSMYNTSTVFKVFVIISQALICGHVLSAVVLNVNPVYQQLEGYFDIPTGFTWQRCVIRSTAMMIFILIAVVVPNFGPVLSLVGGTFQMFTCIIFPIYFHAKLDGDLSHLRMLLYFVIILLAIIGAIGNGFVEIKNIIKVIANKY